MKEMLVKINKLQFHRAGWGIETNDRLEAETPPALAGPPLGG